MLKKIIPFALLPLFLFGCGKSKKINVSSKNTYFSFTLDGNNAIITGLNSNYKNQTDLVVPYSIDKHVVKKIDDNSFDGVYRITKFDMSKSEVEEIGSFAFRKCSNLEKVIYSNTLTKIGDNAFDSCKSIETMDLSNSKVEAISDNMFVNCENLTTVTFPKTLKVLGSNIFSGCTGITKLDYSDLNIETLKDYSLSGLTNLLDVKLSQTTKELGAYSLSNNKKVGYYDLSNTSIEKIGEGAFSNCPILETVNLPASVKELGAKSFYYCSKLTRLDLAKTEIEEIPVSCFELCRSLDEVLISKVKKISSRAFYNSSLTEITITKTVEEIADDALRLCNKLESITVDSGNTNFVVSNNALYTFNKEKLIAYPAACKEKEFTISPNTTVINSYAFADAVNLVTVDLSSIRIDEIGGYTFMNCTSLKSITIGSDTATGVKKIGVKAFFGCKALEEFNGQFSLTEIGESAFYDCIGLDRVYLGESTLLTKIGAEAFFNCKKMTTLSLPASLVTVGRSAFYNCVEVKNFSYGANRAKYTALVQNNEGSYLELFEHFFD